MIENFDKKLIYVVNLFVELVVLSVVLFMIPYDEVLGPFDWGPHFNLIKTMKEGIIVHWQWRIFPGGPSFSDPLAGQLYLPFRILLLYFDKYTAVKYLIIMHQIGSYYVIKYYFQRLGYKKSTCYFSSYIYTFSSFFYYRLAAGHLTYLISYFWIPIVLFNIYFGFEDKKIKYFLYSSFGLAQILYAGGTNYFMFLLILLGGICTYYTFNEFRNLDIYSILIIFIAPIIPWFFVGIESFPYEVIDEKLSLRIFIVTVIIVFYYKYFYFENEDRFKISKINLFHSIFYLFTVILSSAIRLIPIYHFSLYETGRDIDPSRGRARPSRIIVYLLGEGGFQGPSPHEFNAEIGYVILILAFIGISQGINKKNKFFGQISVISIIWISQIWHVRLLYEAAPFLESIRIPSRFMPFLVLGTLGFCANGMEYLLAKREKLMDIWKFLLLLSFLGLLVMFENGVEKLPSVVATYQNRDIRANGLLEDAEAPAILFLTLIITIQLYRYLKSEYGNIITIKSENIEEADIKSTKTKGKNQNKSIDLSGFLIIALVLSLTVSQLVVSDFLISHGKNGDVPTETEYFEIHEIADYLFSKDQSMFYVGINKIKQQVAIDAGFSLLTGYHGWNLFGHYGPSINEHLIFNSTIDSYYKYFISKNDELNRSFFQIEKQFQFPENNYTIYRNINNLPFAFYLDPATNDIIGLSSDKLGPDTFTINVSQGIQGKQVYIVTAYYDGWTARFDGSSAETIAYKTNLDTVSYEGYLSVLINDNSILGTITMQFETPGFYLGLILTISFYSTLVLVLLVKSGIKLKNKRQ